MKTTTFLIILFFVQVSFSQSRYEKDSVQAYAVIMDKIERLDKEGVSKSILVYDSSGKLLLIWKKHKRYRAIGAYYRGKEAGKFKSYRLTKKNKRDINHIIAKPEILNEVSNLDCDKEAYSFTKISVDINNSEFSGSFFSNCPQNESLKPVKSLYYDLFRDR
ncbi:hypothetical protein [Ulvibacterium marinum]|uniref:hypothetical protein n=1 Tax=Ulvibacterium marinum TaxID=2419782 RepID=UPI0024954059|nr:hypothetical protein [Ulvibacterium marinum]